MTLARPFIVMAARFLGPGPTRLKLVRLAHDLGSRGVVVPAENSRYAEDQEASDRPSRRAA
jgi:hypothetical protein